MQYNQNKYILKCNLKSALIYIEKSKEIAKNPDCLQNLKAIKDIEKAIKEIIEKGSHIWYENLIDFLERL